MEFIIKFFSIEYRVPFDNIARTNDIDSSERSVLIFFYIAFSTP